MQHDGSSQSSEDQNARQELAGILVKIQHLSPHKRRQLIVQILDANKDRIVVTEENNPDTERLSLDFSHPEQIAHFLRDLSEAIVVPEISLSDDSLNA